MTNITKSDTGTNNSASAPTVIATAKMGHFLTRLAALSERLTAEQRKEVFEKAGKELANRLISTMPPPMVKK